MDLLSLEKNAGKAGAVRSGMLYSLEHYSEAKYFAFWDADLAVSLDEIGIFFQYASLYSDNYDAIFGSRILKLGSKIERTQYRQWLSRIFVTVTNLFIKGIKSYDSQCGAKIFNKKACEIAFAEPFISAWIFDIEIQLRLKELSLVEYPVKQWREVGGSKIKFFKTALRVAKDIYNIKQAYK